MRKQIDGSTKYETVRQIEAGKISIRHAAEQLGVHPSSVQAWVRLYAEGLLLLPVAADASAHKRPER